MSGKSAKNEILLGDKARDTITGFEGIVVARTEWLQGCERLALQPQALTKDGAPVELEWFDTLRLERVDKSCAKAADEGEEPGGPRADPVW